MKIHSLSIPKNISFLVVCFVLTFLFFSCKKKEEIPVDIIPKGKMAEVLVDVHLSEAMIGEQRYKRDSLPEVVSSFYCDIFEKHEITQQDFEKSLNYYSTHLDEMKGVYEKVVAELNKDN